MALHIGPAPDARTLVTRVELECEGDEPVTLEYVELKVTQAGEEEITLSNDHQALPVSVTLVLSPANQRAQISIGFRRPFSPSVSALLLNARLQTCFGKQYIARVVDYETGMALLETRKTISAPTSSPPPSTVAMLKDLAEVQKKVKRTIVFPKRELTDDEVRTIEALRVILREGRLMGTWNKVAMAFAPDDARNVLHAFENEKVQPISRVHEDVEGLFGIELPLGQVRTTLLTAQLENEDEVRAKLEKKEANNETEIEFRFVPATSNRVVREFLDWRSAKFSPPPLMP